MNIETLRKIQADRDRDFRQKTEEDRERRQAEKELSHREFQEDVLDILTTSLSELEQRGTPFLIYGALRNGLTKSGRAWKLPRLVSTFADLMKRRGFSTFEERRHLIVTL